MAPTPTNPRGQIEQGINEVRNITSYNNSAISIKTDIAGVLEGADHSRLIRDKMDQAMHHLAASMAPTVVWADMRKLLGWKEKLAYMVGHAYGAHADTGALAPSGIVNAASTALLDHEALRGKLDEVLKALENNLLKNENFSEDFILRHAALSTFEAKLKDPEKAELTSIAAALQKLAVDNGFQTLAETMHFQHEDSAQKIMKVSEAMAIMTQGGIAIDAKLMERSEKMVEKIKPLKELDRHYKHLMNTLNMVHRVARKGYPSMITAKQTQKLFNVLKELDVQDPTIYVLDINKVDENGDPSYLDKAFLTLKRKDQIRLMAVLKKNGMSEADFEGRFNAYFSFRSIERARVDFDQQKQNTFGHRLKDYEHAVNAWRGNGKQNILAMHTTPANATTGAPATPRMIGTPLDFASDEDYEFVNSYFKKFPDLFFSNEDDTESGNYDQMRDIVAALVRRSVPALRT